MPNPRRRRSKSMQGRDRSQKKLDASAAVACPKCGEAKLPHRVCPSCGEYKGKSYKVIVNK